MQVLSIEEVDQASGAVDWGVTAAGIGIVIGAIGIAPVLGATALGWAFGAGVAYAGGFIAGTGAVM